jgi:hypothetical protein
VVGMKLIEQVAELLREKKVAMHVDEIGAELVKKYPHIQISSEDLPDKISAILSADLKKNGGKSIFSKPKNKKGGLKRGLYRIKIPKRTISKNFVVPEQPKVTASYTGKAGEHAVLAELLFFGFNASSMAVDDGIDIVASKDNKFFHIQVKTANLSDSGKYNFTLQQRAFDAKNAYSTFYLLVMRTFESSRYVNNFLVLPNNEIRRLVESAVISKADKMSLRVEKDRNGNYVLNGQERLSWALNRFDIII